MKFISRRTSQINQFTSYNKTKNHTQHALKNALKMGRNRSQNHEKSVSGGGFGGPGGILGVLGTLCRQSGAQEGAKMQPSWPKMPPKSPTWANMGAKMKPRWGYVGQPGAQDGQLGNILGGILAPLSYLGMTFLKNV